MSDSYDWDRTDREISQRLYAKARERERILGYVKDKWGNAVMGSRPPFQGDREGSNPSSPTICTEPLHNHHDGCPRCHTGDCAPIPSRWDLLATDTPKAAYDCLHPVTQKCLFMGGKWWHVCLSCGNRRMDTEHESYFFPLHGNWSK